MSVEMSKKPAGKNSNRIVAAVCLAFFTGMIGMAYAAVPLYKMFCQATGYGGTTQRVEKQYAGRVLDREITVRFDANIAGVPWEFQPVQRSMTMKIGETVQAHYQATNKFDRPVTGRATFNVQPELAGPYFNKVECFCFTDTSLKPGETLDMPVLFYVDPDIVNVPELKDVKTITLSYTMFPVEKNKPVASSEPVQGTSKIISDTEANLGG
ncbi:MULTISPECIES: cytochrome c oxidase assembly protein [Mesorhizobium]|uniref:Cytochrome c oxidase assembly protein CtaG n=2 Tax=Mesorhizobium TaxID=68287 RepID=A0A1A5JHE0_RHILI|nr:MULTISPECIES: cytochrome c oxidase assembly protein [Mesorhizobium]MBE1708766.1 cytochrome c oxidase assembly protein [Mesorhizobium japonicum]MBE1713935.1 cytochrome c oxidase assembly protein [Mesorhizobium japonicum]MUT20086.1 cytochrome c oxidase assembly protein [Mesorhizobium japonicum]MUT26056.1 cytochrome c oxidase assembly protein [Mesorhizobium japonicum]OBP75785.1 cytochrome c oxidase assembly protein [Mesorhizobium loti]